MNDERNKSVTPMAMAAGALLSVGLLLYAGRSGTPPSLLVLMAGWVLSPFVLLAVALAVSKRWPAPARHALDRAVLLVAIGSVVIYGWETASHIAGKRAAVWVLAPPISWLIGAAFVGRALLRTRPKRA
jgi:hypothetical protein